MLWGFTVLSLLVPGAAGKIPTVTIGNDVYGMPVEMPLAGAF